VIYVKSRKTGRGSGGGRDWTGEWGGGGDEKGDA